MVFQNYCNNETSSGDGQFGLDYGIANTDGIMDTTILRLFYSRRAKVDTLDTAISYGESGV